MYESPKLKILGHNDGLSAKIAPGNSAEMSIVDVLGTIQKAFSDNGMAPERMGRVKLALLDMAAQGDFEGIIYHAIVESRDVA